MINIIKAKIVSPDKKSTVAIISCKGALDLEIAKRWGHVPPMPPVRTYSMVQMNMRSCSQK